MTVWTKTGNSTWTKINSVFNKTSATTWTELLGVWVKTAASTWTRVFTRVSVPANTVTPAITGSQYLYGTLSGTLGTWTAPNGTNSYARQWQSAANSGGTAGSYGNISGATSSTFATTINQNGRWVRLKVTATNLSGSSEAFSNEVLITKYSTVALTIPVISGSATVNSTLTALTTVGTYWKNTTTISGDTAPDSFSYRWYWGDTGQNIGSDSSTYLVDSNDIGHTIRVEVTATTTGGSASSTSDATSTVGQALQISGVNFKDINGNSGLNNRGNVVTATYTQLGWSVTGVDSGTSFRFRYRILNTQTGAYYNPNNPSVTATASAAWASYSDTYYTLGSNLSGSISGSTATISKSFSLNSTFNGSTYSGGIVRWEFDYELSVTDSSGTRYYWYLGDSMSTTQTNDYYLIDPTSEGTITASPTSGGTSTSITLSGTLNSYPSSLTSYPAAYRVVYGDGTNSSWQYQSYGVSNPTYSVSHTYSSIGTYYPYIETIPSYSTSTATVTIANVLTAPTISNVTAGNSNSQPVTVYFSGGSGPYYQMWWQSSASTPSSSFTPDAYGASSPLTDSSGPGSAGTYYAFVRSVAVNDGSTTGGATVPSSTFSDWSSGYAFTVTQAPIIPTITMGANSGISQTAGTINWTSTNQASFSSTGQFSGSGTTATSITAFNLAAGTNYTGTVTITSSTGNTASANYSLTTSAATPTPNISSIALRNGGGSTASPNSPRMSATITSSNAASISYIMYTGTTPSTGTVAASGTVSTSGSVTVTTNVGAFNNYYEIYATPYSGSGASGISGTTRYAGTKRNTTTASTTTTGY